jgi:hypothetical protein
VKLHFTFIVVLAEGKRKFRSRNLMSEEFNEADEPSNLRRRDAEDDDDEIVVTISPIEKNPDDEIVVTISPIEKDPDDEIVVTISPIEKNPEEEIGSASSPPGTLNDDDPDKEPERPTNPIGGGGGKPESEENRYMAGNFKVRLNY